MRVTELETPALVADLDRVEHNIASLQAYCDEHRLALRPHVKTHKLPRLARAQLDAGAVGIACQKLGEAEVMAESGIDDILLTYPLVGTGKAERLAALAHERRVAVLVDSAAGANGLSVACRVGRGGGRARGLRHGLRAHRCADTRGGGRARATLPRCRRSASAGWPRIPRHRERARGSGRRGRRSWPPGSS